VLKNRMVQPVDPEFLWGAVIRGISFGDQVRRLTRLCWSGFDTAI